MFASPPTPTTRRRDAPRGSVDIGSGDLDVGEKVVGLRFAGLEIPFGATIVSAYVQFQADEADSGTTNTTIFGHLTGDATAFSETIQADISGRPRTSASVNWSPAAWSSVGEAGEAQRTPELREIVQEIVSGPGWAAQQALALILTAGGGLRTAESYDGNDSAAPLLHVEYAIPSGSTTSMALALSGESESVAPFLKDAATLMESESTAMSGESRHISSQDHDLAGGSSSEGESSLVVDDLAIDLIYKEINFLTSGVSTSSYYQHVDEVFGALDDDLEKLLTPDA